MTCAVAKTPGTSAGSLEARPGTLTREVQGRVQFDLEKLSDVPCLHLSAVMSDLHPPHGRRGPPGGPLGSQGRELGHLLNCPVQCPCQGCSGQMSRVPFYLQ